MPRFTLEESKPMKAIWNGATLAESNDTVVLEGNHYFPAESVNKNFLLSSNHRTSCSFKGQAQYHDVFVDGNVNPTAAWYYAEPKEGYEAIRGHIAFYKGVQIVD
jgi:uncharacterized protein (DUF427 family)